MQPWKRKLFISLSVFMIIGSLFLLWLSNRFVVPIMMYHQVSNASTGSNFTSVENFRRHMEFLKEHSFLVLTMEEFIDALQQGKMIRRKTVVITFDDGTEDTYTEAFKILKDFDFPATVFIPSSYIGQEGYLKSEQLKEMTQEGVAVESHSVTHRYLPDLPVEEQRQEVFESKKQLESILGSPVRYFAYPVGGYNDAIKQFAKEAGYLAALTTNRGQRFHTDLFAINRVRFSNKDNKNIILWMKLSGYYNLFRQPKNPY